MLVKPYPVNSASSSPDGSPFSTLTNHHGNVIVWGNRCTQILGSRRRITNKYGPHAYRQQMRFHTCILWHTHRYIHQPGSVDDYRFLQNVFSTTDCHLRIAWISLVQWIPSPTPTSTPTHPLHNIHISVSILSMDVVGHLSIIFVTVSSHYVFDMEDQATDFIWHMADIFQLTFLVLISECTLRVYLHT